MDQKQAAAHCRSPAPLSKGPGDCDQRRANETWTWTMGAERPPGISDPMCGEQFEATPARANRFISIASHRSESADGRIARSTQEDAGSWKDSARRIIRSFARRNRSGGQGPADCERAEPVQYWQPQVGKNIDLLREGTVGVYAVVTDWWKQGIEGQCAGRGGQGLSRQRCATRPRLASAQVSRDVADPRHVFDRASGREHGCCQAEANGRRLETR